METEACSIICCEEFDENNSYCFPECLIWEMAYRLRILLNKRVSSISKIHLIWFGSKNEITVYFMNGWYVLFLFGVIAFVNI